MAQTKIISLKTKAEKKHMYVSGNMTTFFKGRQAILYFYFILFFFEPKYFQGKKKCKFDIKMHESYQIDRKQLEKQTEKSPRQIEKGKTWTKGRTSFCFFF